MSVQLVHNQSILLRREFYNFLFVFTWSSRTPARSKPAAFVPRVLIFCPIAIPYGSWSLWRLSGSLGGLSPTSPPRPAWGKSGPPAPSSSPPMPGNPPISPCGSISSDDSDMGSNSKAMSSGTAPKMKMCNPSLPNYLKAVK